MIMVYKGEIMKLFIHDLNTEDYIALKMDMKDFIVISAEEKYAYCQGCFNCWLKNPGQCMINDSLKHIGGIIGQCEEMIIVSENCYGGYSPQVKTILDRSISTSLPFFTYRNRRLHHRLRYKNDLVLTVLLYGDFNQLERQIAEELVKANGVNIGCTSTKLVMIDQMHKLGGALDEYINFKR